MALLLVLIIAILIGSAFCSGLEAALFSVSHVRAMTLARQERRGAKHLLEIKKRMGRSITVIVILNNAINIVGSILVGYLTGSVLGSGWLGVVSAILTFLIITLGEIIPKSVGENHAEPISLFFAPILLVVTEICSPVIWIFEKMTKRFTTRTRAISEEEIKVLSDLGLSAGTIEKDERELIQNVFLLNDLTAADIMTPRTVVVAFDGDQVLHDIKDQLVMSPHSRFPAYQGSLDHVTGVCFKWELLAGLAQGEGQRKVSEYQRKINTVSEKSRVDYLLLLFQKTKSHLAVVKDSFGTILGLVTLEDVLEQLVGEIVDESDLVVDTRAHARELLTRRRKSEKP